MADSTASKSIRGYWTDDRFSFAHAQFVWDAKSEPGIVDLFKTVWGTDQLTVSFGE